MKKLTEYQKQFLLNTFFKENTSAVGWFRIATKLLDNGKCIVAGTECIWRGGVGNFIKIEKAQDAIDCSLYTFDLDNFIHSEWYKEIQLQHLVELQEEKNKIQEKINQFITPNMY